MNSFYEAEAILKSHGGGIGHVQTSDGILDFQVTNPTTLNNHGATNPEQLFAAGFASCFESALLFIASQSKISVRESQVVGRVAIGNDDQNRFRLPVNLEVDLPRLTKDEAQDLLQKAGAVWPFAQIDRAGIEIQIQLGSTAEAKTGQQTQANNEAADLKETVTECEPSEQISG